MFFILIKFYEENRSKKKEVNKLTTKKSTFTAIIFKQRLKKMLESIKFDLVDNW
jgi:hypothetical protein